MKDLLPKGCPFKMPASVSPIQEETNSSVTDHASIETSLGQGIEIVDTADVSLDREDNLGHEVCCTLQEYDKLGVDHAADDGKKVATDDGVVAIDVDVLIDDIDVAGDSVAVGMEGRVVESGNTNEDEDDDDDRSLCCRCMA